jgi:hypothetical protein
VETVNATLNVISKNATLTMVIVLGGVTMGAKTTWLATVFAILHATLMFACLILGTV